MKEYKTSQGAWQVNYCQHGKQRTIHLGRRFDSASANRVAKIVSEIQTFRKRGEPLPLEVLRKVESLPENVRKSFDKHGLIGGVGVLTLGELLEKFYETRSHLKTVSQCKYKNCGKHLIAFFGKDCRIDAIQKLDCEGFKNRYLAKFSACTVSRRLRSCGAIEPEVRFGLTSRC